MNEFFKEQTSREFEEWCFCIYKKYYQCDGELTPNGPDGGKDIILNTKKGKIFIECKRWDANINLLVAQKLHSVCINEYNVIFGIVVTSGKISNRLRKKVSTFQNKKIYLHDEYDLQKILQTINSRDKNIKNNDKNLNKNSLFYLKNLLVFIGFISVIFVLFLKFNYFSGTFKNNFFSVDKKENNKTLIENVDDINKNKINTLKKQIIEKEKRVKILARKLDEVKEKISYDTEKLKRMSKDEKEAFLKNIDLLAEHYRETYIAIQEIEESIENDLEELKSIK